MTNWVKDGASEEKRKETDKKEGEKKKKLIKVWGRVKKKRK